MTNQSIHLTDTQKVLVVEEAKRRKYAYKAVIASTVGYAMDGFDLLILGFILNAVGQGLGLTSSEAGSLVT